jgi:ribosomal protein L1
MDMFIKQIMANSDPDSVIAGAEMMAQIDRVGELLNKFIE